MVRHCKICKRQSSTLITLFSFPPNPELKKQWATFCKIKFEDLKINDRLCSLHFNASAYKANPSANNKNRLHLKPDAVPTVFDVVEITEPTIRQYNKDRQPRYCCICGALNSNIPRFGFPINDPETTNKWLAVCNKITKNDINLKTQKVCMRHFKDGDFKRSNENQRLLLNAGAVPSYEKTENTVLFNENLQKSKNSITKDSPTIKTPNEQNDSSPPRNYGEFEEIAINEEDFLPETPRSTKRSIKLTVGCWPTLPIKTNINRKFPRYLNDIKTPDCAGSKTAKVILDIARKDIARVRQRSRTLAQQNRQLHKKILTLEATIKELREKLPQTPFFPSQRQKKSVSVQAMLNSNSIINNSTSIQQNKNTYTRPVRFGKRNQHSKNFIKGEQNTVTSTSTSQENTTSNTIISSSQNTIPAQLNSNSTTEQIQEITNLTVERVEDNGSPNVIPAENSNSTTNSIPDQQNVNPVTEPVKQIIKPILRPVKFKKKSSLVSGHKTANLIQQKKNLTTEQCQQNTTTSTSTILAQRNTTKSIVPPQQTTPNTLLVQQSEIPSAQLDHDYTTKITPVQHNVNPIKYKLDPNLILRRVKIKKKSVQKKMNPIPPPAQQIAAKTFKLQKDFEDFTDSGNELSEKSSIQIQQIICECDPFIDVETCGESEVIIPENNSSNSTEIEYRKRQGEVLEDQSSKKLCKE
ncbi:uncharacterized protein LOC129915257 [Episyrphus balteatus]|uniref:uncharacterized protein LOC129915257 n=1 Tax=Episyrphus balteatus TaxID=286459 RepID=UPI002485EE77|nr:uncharacterized protein LOC129915257 [Episyrphus balteatus]